MGHVRTCDAMDRLARSWSPATVPSSRTTSPTRARTATACAASVAHAPCPPCANRPTPKRRQQRNTTA